MKSLLQVLDVHIELRELFAVHCDFVVDLEFGRALEKIESFERKLRAHRDVKEKDLLPLQRLGIEPSSLDGDKARLGIRLGS